MSATKDSGFVHPIGTLLFSDKHGQRVLRKPSAMKPGEKCLVAYRDVGSRSVWVPCDEIAVMQWRTVASISDADLLRRAVTNVARNRPRSKEFAWSAVSDVFALESTFSMQLCRRFGIDPDSGEDLPSKQRSVEGGAA